MSDEPVESEYVGVVRNADTGQVLMVINPDSDSELDNPQWLLVKSSEGTEPVEMIKVPRDTYKRQMTFNDLTALVESLKNK